MPLISVLLVVTLIRGKVEEVTLPVDKVDIIIRFDVNHSIDLGYNSISCRAVNGWAIVCCMSR